MLEDNEILAKGICAKLAMAGFFVDHFINGEDGLYALETKYYDLLVLDLGLPEVDGIEIIKKTRLKKSDIPILATSARDRLDTGADDYICKPFELDEDEIVARVQALLRRSKKNLSFLIEYSTMT